MKSAMLETYLAHRSAPAGTPRLAAPRVTPADWERLGLLGVAVQRLSWVKGCEHTYALDRGRWVVRDADGRPLLAGAWAEVAHAIFNYYAGG